MPSQSRITQVENAMTPKQLAMLEVRRAREHPNMVAHAMSIAVAPPLGNGTLAERIAASVKKRERARDKGEVVELVQEAQKQGLFLACLASECNTAVTESARERALELSLLEIMCIFISRCSDCDESGWICLTTNVGMFQRRTQALLGAVRLIETTYFDNERILYTDSGEDLEASLYRATELLQTLTAAGEGTGGSNAQQSTTPPSAEASREAIGRETHASDIANRLVRMARVRVLDVFDDRYGASRIVAGMLKEGLSDGKTAESGPLKGEKR